MSEPTSPQSPRTTSTQMIELADWLAHMQKLNSTLAHVPQMAEHIAKLKEWEAALRTIPAPAPVAGGREVLELIEAQARRYADMYEPHTDGRNTFIIFANWVASLPSPPEAGPVADVRCEGLAVSIVGFGAHPRLSDEATKSAPDFLPPRDSGERLPSSDAAGSGADTRPSDETVDAWRDIKTAPLDTKFRQRFLLSHWQNGCQVPDWIRDGYQDHGTWWRDTGCCLKPTHWMPLPAPPHSRPDRGGET